MLIFNLFRSSKLKVLLETLDIPFYIQLFDYLLIVDYTQINIFHLFLSL